jgi:hypothetical protein
MRADILPVRGGCFYQVSIHWRWDMLRAARRRLRTATERLRSMGFRIMMEVAHVGAVCGKSGSNTFGSMECLSGVTAAGVEDTQRRLPYHRSVPKRKG